MSSEILHLYGPFSIQAYGLMILFGVLVFMWRASKHELRIKYLTEDQFIQMISCGIVCGIVGGRVLYVLSEGFENFWDIFKIWQGGFSILGSVIGIGLYMPFYLYTHNIAILPVLDLICIYAPLAQSISRIGCFFAGCCSGVATQVPWAVTCDAQLVHPTQLYSAAALFIIFLIVRFIVYPRTKPYAGCIVAVYLILIGLERAIIDFWRSDRIIVTQIATIDISYYQLIAVAVSCIGLFFLCFKKHQA